MLRPRAHGGLHRGAWTGRLTSLPLAHGSGTAGESGVRSETSVIRTVSAPRLSIHDGFAFALAEQNAGCILQTGDFDAEERDVLREIFFRVNKAGKPLTWDEVHDALCGHEGESPSTTKELAQALAEVGMGALKGDDLTSCLVALRGLDVTRTLAEHRRRNPDALRGAVADALPVLLQALSFLRKHCGVQHLRLLPRTFVLEALTRFSLSIPSRTEGPLSSWRAGFGGCHDVRRADAPA